VEEEIAAVRPTMIVALGATAALALFGSSVRVLRDRGTWIASPLAPRATVTVHPSSILRSPDGRALAAARRAFVRDLRAIATRRDDRGG
jgi:uracil-DNA glycosylase